MNLFISALLLFFAFQSPAQTRQKGPNGKWGFVDFEGEIVLPYEYDEIMSPKLDTITVAQKNGKKGVLNKKGEVLIPFEYTEIISWYPAFGTLNGLFAVRQSEDKTNWGFVDKQGQVVLPLRYDYIRCLAPDLLVARLAKDTILQFFDGKGQSVYNIPGQSVEPIEFMPKGFSVVSFMPCTKPKRYYMDGRPFPPNVLWENDHFVIEQQPSGCGVSDNAGRVIVPYEFTKISPGIPGQWIVEKSGNVKAVIDSSGKFIVPIDTQHISIFDKVYIASVVAITDRLTMIDAAGMIVLPLDQWRLSRFFVKDCFIHLPGSHPENYIHVKKEPENLNGLYSKEGREIIPVQYYEVQYCTDRHPLLAYKNVGHGITEAFDFKCKKLLDGEYHTLRYTSDPMLLYGNKVSAPREWGFVRLTDRGKSDTYEFDYIGPISGKFLLAKKNNLNQLFALDGKPITKAIYTRLNEPDAYERKYFPRMPGFTGELVVIARKEDTPPNLVIGINEKGQEFLLDMEAEKAAMKKKIAKEKASY